MSIAGIDYLKERNFLVNTAATDSTWHAAYPNDPYPDVEYQYARSFQVPGVVYVKGGSKSITLTFKNSAFYSLNTTLYITGVRYMRIVDGEPIYTEATGAPFSTSINFSAQQEKSATISISIPEHVYGGWIQVRAKLVSSGGSVLWGDQYTWMDWGKFYAVLQTPIDKQTQPWMDLLDFSCRWADGETDEQSCAQELTKGLFWDSDWTYNGYSCWHWEGTNYNLTEAVQERWAYMDCRDIAGFLYLALQSQGISSSFYYLKRGDASTDFITNLICPLGLDATDDTEYDETQWTFHVVVNHGGVHDASASQMRNLAGSGYRNPPFDWILEQYWQTEYGDPEFFGLVNRPEGSEFADYVLLDSDDLFIMNGIL